VKEGAWLAARAAVYPGGAVREQLQPADGYRTDPLSPLRRSLVVTDPEAAGTPILLIHGILDNRSVFTVFRRALHRRGFGVVHAVNYGLFTGDLRDAARELHDHVERLCEATGADKVHIVGHSLGGVIARYFVQRMGGSARVDTLVTLGSPHAGTLGAYLIPTALGRQLRPGSPLLTELDEPVPGCTTRFLVVWSRMDQMVVPQRNARLQRPDLDVAQLELRDVGHLALPVDGRVVRWVVDALCRRDAPSRRDDPPALDAVASPAS
jgi:pimeloyl-ACP methyl ester carboxylesterase